MHKAATSRQAHPGPPRVTSPAVGGSQTLWALRREGSCQGSRRLSPSGSAGLWRQEGCEGEAAGSEDVGQACDTTYQLIGGSFLAEGDRRDVVDRRTAAEDEHACADDAYVERTRSPPDLHSPRQRRSAGMRVCRRSRGSKALLEPPPAPRCQDAEENAVNLSGSLESRDDVKAARRWVRLRGGPTSGAGDVDPAPGLGRPSRPASAVVATSGAGPCCVCRGRHRYHGSWLTWTWSWTRGRLRPGRCRR